MYDIGQKIKFEFDDKILIGIIEDNYPVEGIDMYDVYCEKEDEYYTVFDSDIIKAY